MYGSVQARQGIERLNK